MKVSIFSKNLLILLTFISINSQAVIIEGNFTGLVRSFENGTEDGTFSGYWANVSVGSVVSGSFWYDTDKAPANSAPNDYSAEYRSYTDEWMGSNFTIDGKTYFISDHIPLDRYIFESEGFNLFDLETTPEYPYPASEIFYLWDDISSGSYEGGYKAVGLMVEVSREDKTLLDGLGIVQEFDWYDLNDPSTYAQAYFSLGDSSVDEMKTSSAWIDISEIHVRRKNAVSVPEPSTLLLFISIGLCIVIRRRQSGNSNSSFKEIF
jgi:hypothetical protein